MLVSNATSIQDQETPAGYMHVLFWTRSAR